MAIACLATSATAFATGVLTHRNDSARTGAILETILSPSTLKQQGFGRLFSLVVDGQIYAQPLVVTNLAMPGKEAHNVVFVATMGNIVYAFDAEGGDSLPFWQTFLGSPMLYDRIPKDVGALLGQYNIQPYIGITSTRVIDPAKKQMYVVAKIGEPQCPEVEMAMAACPVVYRIYELDISSGSVVRKTDIRIPMKNPAVPKADIARRQLQRPALRLAKSRVYAAFGAHQDAPPFQGWMIAFDADTLQ